VTTMATDRRIISALSGDLPETLTPFEDIAARLGLPQKELLDRIEQFRDSGVLRRLGATVSQRKIGLAANAMVVWAIPDERIEEAAQAIVSLRAVTHCYQRDTRPGWPYNLYTMIHCETRKQCDELAATISRSVGCDEYRLLFSAREFTKTSPQYFG
jgi:DNA-binding Lrp family transcriptional regulator